MIHNLRRLGAGCVARAVHERLRQELQPLNCIAGGAPNVRADIRQRAKLVALPRCGEIAIQRVKTQSKVACHGPQQGGIRALPRAAGNARQGDGQIPQLHPFGGLAKNMQPVANLCLFQLAEIGIEFGQISGFMTLKTDIFVQAAGGGEGENLASEVFNAPRIYSGSFIVFINQSFEVSQWAIGFRAGQGWGEVIDDHRLRAPLGLGAFAGIVDDERVDMRHGSQNCLGQAAGT